MTDSKGVELKLGDVVECDTTLCGHIRGTITRFSAKKVGSSYEAVCVDNEHFMAWVESHLVTKVSEKE